MTSLKQNSSQKQSNKQKRLIVPRHESLPYAGTTRTVEEMMKMADGPRGSQSVRVRLVVENIVRFVTPRDKLSQILAIYNWFMSHYGYMHDPISAELVKDPERVVEEIEEKGRFLGDCDDATTFLTAAFRSIGIRARPVRVGFVPGRGFSHVFILAKDQHGRTVAVDPVAHEKTPRMLRRVVTFG